MTRLSPDHPLIHDGATLTDTPCGAYVEIGAHSRLAHSEMQDYSYCDRFSDIANTTVGKFSNIAAMTRIGPTDHPYENAAQHHFLYRSASYWDDAEDDPDFFARRRARRTVLGPDCWIGHGAIVKPEVTIGAGAIVAAGAVVTRDVAPFTIVAGSPARLLRPHLAPDIADRLVALAWWDWDHARLRRALPDFRALPAEAFLDKYGG